MKKSLLLISLLGIGFLVLQGISVFGQDEPVDCSAEALVAFIEAGTTDFITDDETPVTEASPEYVYRLGELYTQFSLDCGYVPNIEQVETQIERTLDLAPLSFIIAQSSIGSDVEVALSELESVDGDAFNGQLLYNGLEVGLDGAELGCAGCHTGGSAGPYTEGTYTRTEEIRLALPELADYTVEQYLVESILHPSAYIVEEYANVQMPTNYGTRLDAQMLADLVAYLESQDQLLDDEASANSDSVETTSEIDIVAITDIVLGLEANASRGEQLYFGSTISELDYIVGCAGCHTAGVIGPATLGTWTRTLEERLTLEQFADYSPEQFLIEAILLPETHLPDGYVSGVMPANYSEQLSEQDLADIIAYLRETG